MIKCNLAVLLAERNLKITKVSKDTGISRTTLTSLANNYAQGIQFDTLDMLAKYLNVSIDKLLISSYVTVDIGFIDVISESELHAVLTLKNGYYEYESDISIEINQRREDSALSNIEFIIFFDKSDINTIPIKNTLKNLSLLFLADINEELCDKLIEKMVHENFVFVDHDYEDEYEKDHTTVSQSDLYNVETVLLWDL